MTHDLPIPGVHLTQDDRVLHLWSDQPLAVVSSAVVGGELRQTRHILNMHVPNDYRCRNHVADLTAMAASLGIAEPFVGMLTAVPLDRAQVVLERDAETVAAAVVTVGISHPVASGVTEAFHARPGTINIILIIDGRLSPAAQVNAIITATEAKTLALVEADVRAPHGGLASGTGTDAIVSASTERGAWHEYAGPISPAGALIGRAVRRAVHNALTSR